MRDLSQSFEKDEQQINEIDFDFHRMSFSDTCSSVTILKII